MLAPGLDVLTFAQQMEIKLRVNDWKGGWESEPNMVLIGLMVQELGELAQVIRPGPDVLIVDETVNVANFAMMLFDNARWKPPTRPSAFSVRAASLHSNPAQVEPRREFKEFIKQVEVELAAQFGTPSWRRSGHPLRDFASELVELASHLVEAVDVASDHVIERVAVEVGACALVIYDLAKQRSWPHLPLVPTLPGHMGGRG